MPAAAPPPKLTKTAAAVLRALPATSPVLVFQSPVQKAALKLQAAYRGRLARLELAAQRPALEAQRARVRSRERRVSFQPELEPEPSSRRPAVVQLRSVATAFQSPSTRAAMKLQAVWRGNEARKQMPNLLLATLQRAQTVQLTARLAGHLCDSVGIVRYSEAASYAHVLVHGGCETAQKFDFVPPETLMSEFGFKPGHIADVERYRERVRREASRAAAADAAAVAEQEEPAVGTEEPPRRPVWRPKWLLLWRGAVTLLVLLAAFRPRWLAALQRALGRNAPV